MEILSPEKIKNDASARVEEQRSITNDAAKEETRIMRRLNIAREYTEKEIASMDEQLASKRAEVLAIIEPLQKEVASLESRRFEALKPINDLQAQAQTKLDEAETRLGEVVKRETAVTTREDEVGARIDKLDEACDALNDREARIVKREEGLEHAEASSKLSQEDLARRWVSYHAAVNTNNKSLEDKHLKIAERESICVRRETDLSEKEVDLANREHVLVQKYNDLAIAMALTQP